MRQHLLLAFCLILGSLAPAASAQNAPDIFAITNAKIVIGNGKTLEKGTIVVRNGLIVAIGDKVALPADATPLDGAGCTLYPGLIDGFTRIGMPPTTEYPPVRGDAYRVARVRAENSAAALFSATDDSLENRRRLGFGAALSAPSLGMINGTSALFSLKVSEGASPLIAGSVAMHIDWTTSDGIRGYPGSLMGKIAATRQALLDAQYAATVQEAYSKNPQGRPRPTVARPIAALIPVVQGKLPVIFHADDHNDMLRAIKICREFKLAPILEGGREAYRIIDALKEAKATVLLSLDLPQPPKPSPSGDTDNNESANVLAQLRYRASIPRTAALLSQANIPFALTTAGMDSPDAYQKNVRKLIAAGLSEEKAVAALTSVPAEIFGVSKQLGTLETGKIANVLAVQGGTLFDGKGKLKYVFVDGKQVEVSKVPERRTASAAPSRAPVNIPLPPGVTPEQALETLRTQPDLARPFLPPGVTVEMAIAALSGSGGGNTEAKGEKNDEDKVVAPPEVGIGPVPPLPPAVSSSFIIRGATVWTSGARGILPNTDIYVKDGKIAKIGSNLSVPGGTLEILAQGKHVTPGMIDCHSHTAIDRGINEGSNIITAECRIQDVIDPDDVNIYRQLAGGTTAGNILHGSANAIGGQNAVVKWRWGKSADEMLIPGAFPGIKFALGENPKQSNFSQPGRPRRYPATRAGVEKVIRDAFQAAKDYQEALAAYKAGKTSLPPPRDLQTETIVELLEGKRVIHSHCYRQDEILMLIRLTQEYGIRIATLQHVLEGYKVADEMAKAGIGGSTFSDWWAYKLEAYDAIPYNAALMSERGVLVSLNSDSDELARRLNLEAAKAVRYGGMPPVEALKLVTINPAKQLGIDRVTGSLEEGKDADIVIWSGDPLSTRTICEKTFVDGQLYFDRAADIAARPALEAEKKRLIAAERPERKPSTGGKSEAAPVIPATAPAVAEVAKPITAQPGLTGPVTAITGATVHPVTGPDIPNGVVLVQGGKIAAVGAADSVPVPAQATVYDAKGLHLYPGLIDSDSTTGLVEIDSFSSSDDTSEIGDFNPEIKSLVAINPESERIGVARQAGVLTINTVPRNGTISGVSALVQTDGWTWEDMAVRPDSGLYINFPTLGFRRFGDHSGEGDHCNDVADDDHNDLDDLRAGGGIQQPEPGQRGRRGEAPEEDQQIKELDRFIADARRYQTARKNGDKSLPPLPRDAKLEAMLPVLEGKLPVFIRVDREADIRKAVSWAKTNHFRLTLVGGQQADRCSDLLSREQVPLIFGPVLNLPRFSDSPYDDIYALPGALSKAGVKVILSPSTGGSGEVTRRLAQHAAMAAAFGLAPEEALKSITLYPAQVFGVSDRLGSLEPGKDATIVLTTGDILEITSDVKAAWIKGAPSKLTNKQTQLYEKYRSRPRK